MTNSQAAIPYRVLARKYRPTHFGDLIGQEAMVRTLRNAFSANRIAQAYMLTGVRGIGKTTTARILARALNFQTASGESGPTVDRIAVEEGIHCRAIIESRHVDVVEMDAASHTGVDDVRDLIEGSHYRPVSARYKVYIIDEVHMLSTAAFNALLKTLEEPPEHVKFIFATTEIRKVPVTVLSRCQRFDLRRIDIDVLTAHLAHVCQAEEVPAEDAALQILARAAEGSVRDSLSLLDQAIAHGNGRVSPQTVEDMLGLADRAAILDLFEHVMAGKLDETLPMLRGLYMSGADPTLIVQDLARITHLATRIKAAPQMADDGALTEAERTRASIFAGSLTMAALSHAWQMLLKGMTEVQTAPEPVAAAEMLLIRIAYAVTLPDPSQLARKLLSQETGNASQNASISSPQASPERPRAALSVVPMASNVAYASRAQPMRQAAASSQPQTSIAPATSIKTFEDILERARLERDITLKMALEKDVRFIALRENQLEIALSETARRDLVPLLSSRLLAWTGQRWVIAIGQDSSTPTVAEVKREKENELRAKAEKHPMVLAILQTFPGAKMIDVRLKPPVQEAEALQEKDSMSNMPDGSDPFWDHAEPDDLWG
jgi:DNA polymerase III subunit gamma/tau